MIEPRTLAVLSFWTLESGVDDNSNGKTLGKKVNALRFEDLLGGACLLYTSDAADES